MAEAKTNIESYLDYLYKMDYKERPVSVERFLSDPKFLGKLTSNGRGVFPVWKQKLGELLNEDSLYLAVLTGAIGIGKTRAALWAVLYIMHRVMCLKDPWAFFGLTGGGKIAIVFFNLTKSLSESRGFTILQSYLTSSDWFIERGILVGKDTNRRLDINLFEYRLASPFSQGFSTIGQDVLVAIMDEVDSPVVSDKQKQRVLQAYEATVRRFESRFVDKVYNESIGKFFLVASKQEQHSFLDVFISERKGSKNVFVADIKAWEVKEEGTYSGKTFSVMTGDVYTPPKILVSKEEVMRYQKEGKEVIEVPIEFLDDFERDVVGSLRDIAGVTAIGLRKSKLFPSEKIIYSCYDETKQDPASMSTIVMSLDDDLDLIKFFDLKKVRIPKHIPRYIHCDIAYSGEGDALSLAMSGVKRWVKTDAELPDGSFEIRKVPIIETDFVIRLKGKQGSQVPIYKVRKFILDLRTYGFNIKLFTADLALLSTDTQQILSKQGIPCDYLSLDRDIKPYLTFKELVDEQRWICHRCNMLHFELANLEYDKNKQKINHPDKVEKMEFLKDGGTKTLVVLGSKDMSDATAGSVFSAVKDSLSVPVDSSTIQSVVNAMKSLPKRKSEEQTLIDLVTKGKDGFEQYLLQDDRGHYWMWTKENAVVSPTLTGPFSERIVNLPVIQSSNPAQFSPKSTAPIITDDQRFKLDILKLAGRRS
jgi:hypothetical protein